MSIFKIEFFVPEPNLEEVKSALFKAGAGRFKNYDCCCWQTLGTGHFRPLLGSQPHIGKVGDEIETVLEYKVEMVCEAAYLQAAITSLISAHPYEEPAYYIYDLYSTEA